MFYSYKKALFTSNVKNNIILKLSTVNNQRINRELRPLENRLKRILLNFYNDKIANSLTPVESLKQKYDKRLKLVISKTIQDSYMVAVDLIARQTGSKQIPISISPKDMTNIDRLVNEAAEAFWITARKLKQREIEFNTEQDLIKNRIAAFNLFDKVAAFIGNAAKAVFSAFNTGVVSKLSEVKELVAGDLELVEVATFSNRVRFTTAGDAKVDPTICEPLEGREFDVDDPELTDITPPLHLHCRCRLVPV